MSALGHKRTNHCGPKRNFVGYCPKADKNEEAASYDGLSEIDQVF